MTYKIFVRNWYRVEASTGRLIPDPTARKTSLGFENTEEQAREACRWYNERNKPGKLSRKAEYTKA